MRSRTLGLPVVLLLSALLASSCAQRQPAVSGLDRAERIAVMIVKAEKMGARECSPRALARVKVKLELALHELEENHYPSSWTQAKFDETEKMAQELLQTRVLAQQSGIAFHCVHREG